MLCLSVSSANTCFSPVAFQRKKTMNNPVEDFTFSDPFSSWWPFIFAVVVGIVTTVRGYLGGPKCPSEASVTGKTIVITGGTSGVGLEAVLELGKRGGRVIIGARNVDSARETLKTAGITEKNEKIIVKELDLSRMSSVRKFADGLADETRIDILINNGAVIFQPFHKTEEGFELHFATNYLSHFLLTQLLMPKLKSSPEARVINMSAQAHYVSEIFLDDLNIETHYTPNKAFGQSKLALVLMTVKMAKELYGTNVTINAMHPGIVRDTKHLKNSPLNRSLLVKVATWPWVWLLTKTPQQGAQTLVYLAVAPELSTTTGKYFSNCSMVEPSEKVHDTDLVDKLYSKSLELVRCGDNCSIQQNISDRGEAS